MGPPRASQPPIVGVVAPVKKEDVQDALQDLKPSHLNDDKLQAQSPQLHKLLHQQPSMIKSEIHFSSSKASCLVKNDLPAQIVPPSSGAAKRNLSGYIKEEPASPE